MYFPFTSELFHEEKKKRKINEKGEGRTQAKE